MLITLLPEQNRELARSCDVFIVEIVMFYVKHLLFMYDQSLSTVHLSGLRVLLLTLIEINRCSEISPRDSQAALSAL